MSGLPFQSKLAPFEREIVELRRQRPPFPYRRIVELLKEKYGIDMTINGVFAFLRTRRKWDRKAAAESKTPAPPVDSQGSHSRQPNVLPTVITHHPLSNDSSTAPRKRFNYTYSNTYNLTRLTPDEKAALEKRLDEEKGRQT